MHLELKDFLSEQPGGRSRGAGGAEQGKFSTTLAGAWLPAVKEV